MNRPVTLQSVAAQSESIEDFGRYFQDWLHGLARATSRPQIAAAIGPPPARLARRFPQGAIADAWLAAYAELIARRTGLPVPAWTAGRVAPEPWFASADHDIGARLAALRDAPGPFKARNLFTEHVDLPLSLSPGRPAKSSEELRRNNAERQRRFRERRRMELLQLRRTVRA